MSESLSKYLTDHLPEYVDLLQAMVEINSFTANPTGVNALSEMTAGAFQALGFKAEYVQSVNPGFGRHLFLYSPNWHQEEQHAIALVSHLDTVFPPEEELQNDFYWRIVADRAFGPGTVDIKGGTVMILMVLSALKTHRPEIFSTTRWLVCLDASEETLSEDFGQLCLNRLPSDALACLIFEGGTPNSGGYPVVTARKGRAEYRVIVEGRGAHAGNYHKHGANAIVQMAHTIQKIATLTDYDRSLTFNAGVINGGTVVNRVPHYAELIVEMRAFDLPVFEQGKESILALNGSSDVASQDGFPCQVTVELISQTPPWPRNPETDRLYQIWKEAAAEAGLRILPEQRGGLSDGNAIWQVIPTLDGLGPSGNNAHCSERSSDGSKDQEFVLLSSFVPKARINIAGITRLIQQHTQDSGSIG